MSFTPSFKFCPLTPPPPSPPSLLLLQRIMRPPAHLNPSGVLETLLASVAKCVYADYNELAWRKARDSRDVAHFSLPYRSVFPILARPHSSSHFHFHQPMIASPSLKPLRSYPQHN